jgi:DegV family protein with EDD domain
MTIKILTDSTCDLPETIVRENEITVVPIYIIMGLQEYRDGVDLTRQEFYQRLPEQKLQVTTATPSPEMFRQTYQKLVAEGATEILSIHISSKLSSLVDAARQAPERPKKPL